MSTSISVIVRSKNEEKTVGRTLRSIWEQSLQPREVILIDNASTDRTKDIARDFGCTIVNISDDAFNHATSCNIGAARSTGDLMVFTNAHAFPTSPEWLRTGVEHFTDSRVAGVYGLPLVDGRASLPERLVETSKGILFGRPGFRVISQASIFCGLGLMSTSGAMLRRDLWEAHPFDVGVSARGGGEDSEWGFYFLRQGYRIIEDAKFAVYHCHGDSVIKYLKRSYSYYLTYFHAYRRSRAN
ncbi:MAG: glycosyltransferase family 2 protein [Chloroflexota bacterium]